MYKSEVSQQIQTHRTATFFFYKLETGLQSKLGFFGLPGRKSLLCLAGPKTPLDFGPGGPGCRRPQSTQRLPGSRLSGRTVLFFFVLFNLLSVQTSKSTLLRPVFSGFLKSTKHTCNLGSRWCRTPHQHLRCSVFWRSGGENNLGEKKNTTTTKGEVKPANNCGSAASARIIRLPSLCSRRYWSPFRCRNAVPDATERGRRVGSCGMSEACSPAVASSDMVQAMFSCHGEIKSPVVSEVCQAWPEYIH